MRKNLLAKNLSLHRKAVKLFLTCSLLLFFNCSEKKQAKKETLFRLLDPSETNIDFKNELSFNNDFNVYTYRNFYNGGGVALGDINNDGLVDIFFTANMLANRLYLNKGNFKFEDITEKAGITKKAAWSTGASMADVNGDGFIDIYVCNSGDVKGDNKQNELFINNGDMTFSEKAEEYGIADHGFSTHAAFFDYDKDGDLDMYLLNNSFKAIGSFNLRDNQRNVRDSLGGHKFFINENGKYKDISERAGIYGSVIGFGLGVTVGDIDKDGWQDIYVSNDFFERDYLYMNDRKGGFKESLEDQMISISAASMGADLADLNNDGFSDIFVTEMLAEDEGRLKSNTSFENWYRYQFNVENGYHHQFTRNMLQLNNGNNTFSEVGRLAGVHATDWSWGALIADLDNDGKKDIFVANGMYQDLTNQDYIRYASDKGFVNTIVSGTKVNFKKLIDLIPSNPVPNYAFQNDGNLKFTNKAEEWGLATPSFSNGSAYGDLDNDGDLDLVVNNLNMASFVYENQSRQLHPENNYLRIKLEGEGKNKFALGTKVTLYHDNSLSYQEQMPIRGFESSVDHRLTFGLGRVKKIDSILVEWPDGKISKLSDVKPNHQLALKQSEASIKVPADGLIYLAKNTLLQKSKDAVGIDFQHMENVYNDFDKDRLLFHMVSTQGPAVAKGDVNGDGLEDVFFGGAKGSPGGLYFQTYSGTFEKSSQETFEIDKESEDVAALMFDADKDHDLDLYVCSGGTEFSYNSPALLDRLYFNDGTGKLSKSNQVLPSGMFESTSCVSASDFDLDGDQDLFVGVRLEQFRYGIPVHGYLLENDGKGNFKDVTFSKAPEIRNIGMITSAEWMDYNKDGKPDLVVAGDYMAVSVFLNEGGTLKDRTTETGLGDTQGWWNRIKIADVNGDGFPDIIAGNHGLNSRFKASKTKPINMYVSDFDQNGKTEHILTCFNGEKSYPMCLRDDVVGQIPHLKKKYYKYENYKEQTITDIFTKEELARAVKLTVNELASCIFINDTKGKFIRKPLPVEAQFAPVYGISVNDFDGDGIIDLLLGGNLYEAKPEVGIYDASFGLMLKGNGTGEFTPLKSKDSGILVKGAVRDITEIKSKHKSYYLFALNNNKSVIYEKGKKIELANK